MPDGAPHPTSALEVVSFSGCLPYLLPVSARVLPWGDLDVANRRGDTRRACAETARIREALHTARCAFGPSGLAWPEGRVLLDAREVPTPTGLGDLAVAVAVAQAAGHACAETLRGWGFVAELQGEHLHAPRGLLAALRALSDHRDGRAPLRVVIPTAARDTVRRYPGALPGVRTVYAATLRGALRAVTEDLPGDRHTGAVAEGEGPDGAAPFTPTGALRRALLVAAATGAHLEIHNAPPGTGAALARTVAALLPGLDPGTARHLSELYDLAGLDPPGARPTARPLPALRGTDDLRGTPQRPGALALAHGQVLVVEEPGRYSDGLLNALTRAVGWREVEAPGRPAEPADVQLVTVEAPAYDAARERALWRRRRQHRFDGLGRGSICLDLARTDLELPGDDTAPMTVTEARGVVDYARRAYRLGPEHEFTTARGRTLTDRLSLALFALDACTGRPETSRRTEAAALTPTSPR